MARRRKPGIFCLEGDWSPNLRNQDSVRPLLQFLQQDGRIDFIHRDVGTPEELEFYVNKWSQRSYSSYRIGYFAFHGKPGRIFIGRRTLTLEQLGDIMEGACDGKIIYFGTCATLDVPRRELQEFRERTRARCVCGYTEDVDWFSSSAFDLLLFSEFIFYKRMDAIEQHLKRYKGLQRELGFRMYW